MSEKKLKGALIGYGFVGAKGHLAAYAQRFKDRGDVEIVAIADVCEERRWLVREAFPEMRLYTDGAILIEQEAEGLDFVDITTPPNIHAALASAALDQGLHVLCETPLTFNSEDAARLIQKAIEKKRVLFPCHNYRHAPVVKAIRDEIRAGRIGKVRSATLSTYLNSHAKGVGEWKADWRRERATSGGGIAMDQGSHAFYLASDWMGSSPTTVTAKTTCFQSAKYDTEDSFYAVSTFPTGLAHVHLTWTAGARKTMYTVQGDRGAITVDEDQMQIAIQERTEGSEIAPEAMRWQVENKVIPSHWVDESRVHWFGPLFDQFRSAIDNQEFAGREAQDAFRSIEWIETAYRSASEKSLELLLPNGLARIL